MLRPIRAAWQSALRDAGAVVEEIELPWTTEDISRTMFTHFGYLLGPAMEDETAESPELLAAYTRRFMADARKAAAENRFIDGIRAETRIQAELAAAMAGFDALICPASAVAALDADGMYLDGIDARGRAARPLLAGSHDGTVQHHQPLPRACGAERDGRLRHPHGGADRGPSVR